MIFTERLLKIINEIEGNIKEERAKELERLTNKQSDFFHFQRSNFGGSSLKNFADVKSNKEAYEKYLKTKRTLKANFDKFSDRLNEINKDFENQNESILKEKEEIEQNLKMIKEAIEECDAFIKKYELKEGKAKNLMVTFETQDFSEKPMKKALESMISLIDEEIERKKLQIVKFTNVNVNILDKDIDEKKIIANNIIEKTEELNRKLGLLEVYKKALKHHLKEALTKEELEVMTEKFTQMYKNNEDITLTLAKKQEEKEVEEAKEESVEEIEDINKDFDTSKLADNTPKNFNNDNGLKTESINPNFVDADSDKKKVEFQKFVALLGSYINTENSKSKDELDLEEIKSRLEELKYYVEDQASGMDEVKDYLEKIGCSLRTVEEGIKVEPMLRKESSEEIEKSLNKMGCSVKKENESKMPELPKIEIPLVPKSNSVGEKGYKLKNEVTNSVKPKTSGVGDTMQDVEDYLAKMGCKVKEETKRDCLLTKKEQAKKEQPIKENSKKLENEKEYTEFKILLNNILNGFEQITDEKEAELNKMYDNLTDEQKKLHFKDMNRIDIYNENLAHDEMKLEFVPAKRGFFERIGSLTFKGGSKLSMKLTARRITKLLDKADDIYDDEELNLLEKKYDKLSYKLARKSIINTSDLSRMKNKLEKKKFKLYNGKLRNYKTITRLADNIEYMMWDKLKFELSLVKDNYGEAFVSTVIEQYLYLISISNKYKKHVEILNKYIDAYARKVLSEKEVVAVKEMLRLIYNYRSNKKDAIFEFDRENYYNLVESYTNEGVQKVLK